MKGVAMQQTNSLNVAAEKVIHDFLKRFTDNKHFATDKEKEEFIEETIKVVNIVVDDTKSSNNIRVNELKQEIVDELRNELATKAD
ncbi:hypothetical protein CQA37_09900, partial [Helicobacter sp. MIT 99-10781]|uniref:hypothetical protein n=2 Tax=unclassified Helicobacter TaxID=2593540 RepID=UPI000E39CE7A